MNKIATLAAPALALLLGAGPVLAAQQIGKSTELGKTDAEVRAALKKMGATVEELDKGKGVIEAQYSMNGQSHEVRVDAKTGRVLSIDAAGDDAAGDE